MMIKLSEWCQQNGVKYLTGYRWFKEGKLPVDAIQTDSGTILVSGEKLIETQPQPDEKLSDSPVSQLIKKAFEMSKNGEPVEDLATFVISNFKLEKHGSEPEPVRKNRVKPSKEMTENHFKKFLKHDKLKPEAQMFLVNQDNLESVVAASEKASAIEDSLNVEITDAQTLGTVVPAGWSNTSGNAINLAHSSGTQFQSIASAMNSAITDSVYTPTSYTGASSVAVFGGTLASGGTTLTQNLSAANVVSSAQNLSAQPWVTVGGDVSGTFAPQSVLQFVSPAGTFSIEPEDEDDVTVYNPVTYDEARLLVELIMDSAQKQNMLAVDKKAKEICKLGRETFELMLNATKNQGK